MSESKTPMAGHVLPSGPTLEATASKTDNLEPAVASGEISTPPDVQLTASMDLGSGEAATTVAFGGDVTPLDAKPATSVYGGSTEAATEVALDGASTPLDAKPATSMDGGSAEAATAASVGMPPSDHLLSRNPVEREEGECSSSNGDAAYEASGPVPTNMDCKAPGGSTAFNTRFGNWENAKTPLSADASAGRRSDFQMKPSVWPGEKPSERLPLSLSSQLLDGNLLNSDFPYGSERTERFADDLEQFGRMAIERQRQLDPASLAQHRKVPTSNPNPVTYGDFSRSSRSVPEKRAPSPRMIEGDEGDANSSKRRKMTLEDLINSIEHSQLERSRRPNVQHGTGANLTSVGNRGQNTGDKQQLAHLNARGPPNTQTVHVTHGGRGSIRFKEEPQDNAPRPFAAIHDSAAERKPACGLSIFYSFASDQRASQSNRHALNLIQSQMDHFVLASHPTEKFDLVCALQSVGISVSKLRRKNLASMQIALDLLRATRLIFPTQLHSVAASQYTGVEDVRHPQPQPGQPSQLGLHALNHFQTPPSRAISHEVRPAQVFRQEQDIASPVVALRSEELAHHGRHGRSEGVTVLTLPRLDIDQSPPVQQFAKNMMDEANSLLHIYSNMRLAFSAQDMGRH